MTDGEHQSSEKRARLDRAAQTLPDGLHDGVSAHLMANEVEAEDKPLMARLLANAARGIPATFEQEERWHRLGLLPVTKGSAP